MTCTHSPFTLLEKRGLRISTSFKRENQIKRSEESGAFSEYWRVQNTYATVRQFRFACCLAHFLIYCYRLGIKKTALFAYL